MANKYLAIFLLLFPAFIFLAAPVQAAVRCETQYGGGQVCVRTGNLQVNKQIKNTSNSDCGGDWVDNFTETCSKRYQNGEIVEFRLQVKNVGDAKLDRVTVTDSLPGELQLSSGNLTQELQNLEVGQTQEVFINAKVVGAGNSINCNVVNTAEVRSGDQFDKDTARICIGKGEVVAKALPKAGPEDNFAILGLSILAISTGIFLLKSKAKIYA